MKMKKGISGGEKIGIEKIIKDKEMEEKNVENLGVMEYDDKLKWVKNRKKNGERLNV
jgi:hypothetical protein